MRTVISVPTATSPLEADPELSSNPHAGGSTTVVKEGRLRVPGRPRQFSGTAENDRRRLSPNRRRVSSGSNPTVSSSRSGTAGSRRTIRPPFHRPLTRTVSPRNSLVSTLTVSRFRSTDCERTRPHAEGEPIGSVGRGQRESLAVDVDPRVLALAAPNLAVEDVVVADELRDEPRRWLPDRSPVGDRPARRGRRS